MTKFPWAELMHKGLGLLHLSPQEFWRSTPREIARAFGAPSQPMNVEVLRQKLDEMREQYPDIPPSPSRGEGKKGTHP
jgi:uncharacterized phage protein (TIGR02216 family)